YLAHLPPFSYLSHSTSTILYTLSLHDALPICFFMAEYYRILSYLYRYDKKKKMDCKGFIKAEQKRNGLKITLQIDDERLLEEIRDRKSTRLNSSHVSISYAVFCLKKKKKNIKS